MCEGGVRPSTAHCISDHTTLPVMPGAGGGTERGGQEHPGAPRRGKRRHSAVSTIYSLLGYLVHGVHTANTTQAPQGRQRPRLQSYGRAGAPPGLPSCPPRGLPSSPHGPAGAPGQRGTRVAPPRAQLSRSPHSICGQPAGRSPLPLPAWRLPWVAGVEAGCERWRGGGRGGGRGRWGARPGLSTRGWPRRGTARRPPSRPRCPRTCPALPARSPAGEEKVSGHAGVSLKVPKSLGTQPSGSPSSWGHLGSRAQGCGPWHPSFPYGNTALTVPPQAVVSFPWGPWCPKGHSPRCFLSACGTWSSATPPMGTQSWVSPPPQPLAHASQEGHPHHLCTLDKLLGGSISVVLLPTPGTERRRLQRPPVGEGEGPWPHQRACVDGIEVDGSLLLTLTPRQEGDTCGEQGYGTGGDTGYGSAGLCHMPRLVPGTAGGTVRRRAVTVAMAISSGLYLVGQECPGVTMLGFSRVPSR